jgi:fructose-bisphosphate aldolase, class II
MPLVSMKDGLARAQKGGWAIPLFDTFDGNSTEGMFESMEAKHAPAILAVYYGTFDTLGTRGLAGYIRARAEASPLPVALMLDHGTGMDQCIRAIRWGFTDVMFDGSALPLEENIAHTREIVRAAHAAGVGVEAELGHVGSGSEYQSYGGQRKGFTNPEEVERFVDETGVDALAISIGSAHGLYHGEPSLDLDLLAKIRSRVEIPLVMHGGTGLSVEQFCGAISGGISKINVATDLFTNAGKRMVDAAQKPGASYFSINEASVNAFCERAGVFLDLFGASGNAW